jgi:predicted HicB family RNase H-like nuclease
LRGSADFYADISAELKKEGALFLRVFLEECAAHGVEARKAKGNFTLHFDCGYLSYRYSQ